MNFSVAFEYFNASAALGNPKAQRELAFMYETGKGTPVNKVLVCICQFLPKKNCRKKIDKIIEQALLYYTFAARSFDSEASVVLGNKYLKGYSVNKSCISALSFFKTPAEKGIKKIFHFSPPLPSNSPFIHYLSFSRLFFSSFIRPFSSKFWYCTQHSSFH